MATDFPRNFGPLTSPVPLSYLDDNFGQLQSASTSTVSLAGAALIGYISPGSGAISSDAQTEIRRVVWVEQYGALGDGTTDDTTAIANALTAGTGGIVRMGEGTFIASTVAIPSDTILMGSGFGTVLKHKASSSVDLIKLADATATVRAQVRDLKIDGNKANQSSALNGINFDNSGSSGLIPRHRIENVWVNDCKAVGIRLGALTKETILNNANCYNNDTNGFELAGADSQISNCIAGQSGTDGWRISGSSMMLSNCKSWFSGRLTAGSAGFLFRNSENIIGNGLHAQENSGAGFSLFGQSGALEGHVLQGISDSDNTAASTHAGWNLNNVDGAIIIAKTTKFSGGAGTPNYGMNISTTTTNCKIVLNTDSQASFPVNGVNANANDISVNKTGHTAKADVGNAAATLTLGTSEETQIWNTELTVDRAVTLTASPAWAGGRFRIVRTANATGAFNLNVGTGPLKALGIGEWCEVTFNGTAWVLTAYGAL